MRRPKQLLRVLSALLIFLVMWQWSSAGWILAKAQVAQWLIADAWADTLVQQTPIKPWSWADTWPVARMQFPEHDVDLYVLAGAEGNSLAFGPGHHQGSALPGAGMSVIGGHRDTHFRFLKNIVVGDRLTVQLVDGQILHYRISRTEVVDINRQPLLIAPDLQGLVLVTCYPFDALNPNGPLRLLVWAEPLAATASTIAASALNYGIQKIRSL